MLAAFTPTSSLAPRIEGAANINPNQRHDFHAHLAYCWLNPVKHGLVADIDDWPFSSHHRDRPDRDDLTTFQAALDKHAQSAIPIGFGERD